MALWLSLYANLVAAYLLDGNDDLKKFSPVELIRAILRNQATRVRSRTMVQ